MRAADHLIAISEFTKDHVTRHHGVRADIVDLVPCTFDVGRFSIGPKPPGLLERFGLRADQPVLLTVSRLALSERYKGHRQVLIALQSIVKVFPDVRYIIAGVGDDLPRLKEFAAALGLEQHVIFAGHVPVDELPLLYQVCDLFLMPSAKEGFGIVFLEAMSSGKPVIAGNMDGSVDALDHGRLGALVDPGNTQEIARVVCEVLQKKYPNALMFDPPALREAVAHQFGYERVRGLLADSIRPLVEGTARAPAHGGTVPAVATAAGSRPAAMPKVVVMTQLTSPYQVEFFNALAAAGGCNLEVVYLTSRDSARQWAMPRIGHSHMILSETPELAPDALNLINSADLAVFNYYTHPFAVKAIRSRAAANRPWVFWGERPGFFHLGPIGSTMRRVLLAPLHRSHAPIWGVGRFGVDGYRNEFSHDRTFHNVSYYSNLSRFDLPRTTWTGPRTILYSGTMIRRKGVDLLARAFATVAAENPEVRLLLVGDGKLAPEMSAILAPFADRVEWAGFQSWEKLPEHYARSHVFCFPSRYDGWGLALVEALASGLPVIGTDQTGAALEFVNEENGNGWLIPADDLAALVAALRAAVALSEREMEVMSQKARQSVLAHSLRHGTDRFAAASLEAISEWGP